MKKSLVLSLSIIITSSILIGCGEKPKEQNQSNQKNEENEAPLVFVFSGQSNMEGQTNVGTDNSYLLNAFDELGIEDGQCCIDGIDSVLTSFYGNGYGELSHTDYNTGGQSQVSQQPHASNTEDKIKGKFLPTKVGMGHSDSQMGPELGCAYVLKDYATSDRPIYFVKMASSGSGFEQSGTQYNWLVHNDKTGEIMENNLFDAFLKPFLHNNLDWIEEETGEKPIIKAWCWHQGESDASENKINKYADRLADLIDSFREEFADYAEDEDGDNIAFIDGMPYEGGTMLASPANAKALNEVKLAAADENDNRYIVDNYGNREHIEENILKVSGEGSTSGVHYNTKDDFVLGMAYGQVIIDNILD